MNTISAKTPAKTGRRIYLAARYSRRLELCGYREELTALEYEITSRWLNGSHQIDNQGIPIGDDGERRFEMGDPALAHWREHFATEDVADVLAAEVLVAFTEEPRSGNSRGGRHVELGVALGAGKRIVIVGPRENVFCWLPGIEWYPDLAAMLAAWGDRGDDFVQDRRADLDPNRDEAGYDDHHDWERE